MEKVKELESKVKKLEDKIDLLMSILQRLTENQSTYAVEEDTDLVTAH
jgi:hypothetical protein